MQALLASPSQFSPPPSPTSSSPGSPRLPALSSPFNPNKPDSSWEDSTAETDTPTRSTSSSHQPAWMSDVLEEEWIQQDSSSDEDEEEEEHNSSGSGGFIETPRRQHQREHAHSGSEEFFSAPPPSSTRSISSYRTTSTSVTPITNSKLYDYASVNKPRVPSSLRYGFTSSLTASTTSGASVSQHEQSEEERDMEMASEFGQPEPEDHEQEGQDGSPASSSAGTFVMRGSPSGSYKISQGEESQLKAAARAFKSGPSAGLGAPLVEDVEEGEVATPIKGKKGADKLGLMRLFEPPSPPAALPSSDIPAPSADEFTFSPPSFPLTTMASISRRTPPRSSEATPVARSAAPSHPYPVDAATPTRLASKTAPAPKPKDRYLRSDEVQNQTQPIQSPSPPRERGSQTPFPTTPAPRPADGTPVSAPRSQLRLFEFQYDTFTRNHLNALVDEIDELNSGSNSGSFNREDREWETSFVEVVDQQSAQDGDVSDELGVGRSTKRIRLSPREDERGSALGERNGRARRARDSLERRHPTSASTIGSTRPRRRTSTTSGGSPSYGSIPRSPQPRARPSIAGSVNRSARSAASATSLPFAHSLDNSERRLVAPSSVVKEKEKVLTTRDRLGEANALLDRIRAKMTRKDDKSHEKLFEVPTSEEEEEGNQGEDVEQRYPDELDLASDDEEEQRGRDRSPSLESSQTAKSKKKNMSPRKILRRLSAAEEVDEEIRQDKLSESTTHDEHLPRLATAASASLRSVLGDTTSTISGSNSSSIGHGRKPSESTPGGGRRHFARTPLSHKRAPRSGLDGLFNGRATMSGPLGGEGSSGESDRDSFANVTPSHARHTSLTTIAPSDVEALLASTTTPSRMIYDKDQGKWIKGSRNMLAGRILEEGANESTSTEDDPFRDLDSTRGSDLSRPTIIPDPSTVGMRSVTGGDVGLSGLGIKGASGTPMTPAVVVSPPDANHFLSPPAGLREDGDEMADDERDTPDLWGRADEPFSEVDDTDELQVETKQDATEDTTEGIRDESPYALFQSFQPHSQAKSEDPTEEVEEIVEVQQSTLLPADVSAPLEVAPHHLTTSPPAILPSPPNTPRPVPVSTRSTPAVVPRSALKPTPVRAQSAPGLTTPKGLESEPRPPRSVSFSDGKTNGRIEGLEHRVTSTEKSGSRLKFEVATSGEEGGAEDFGEPGSLELVESDAFSPTLTIRHPSKTSYTGRALQERQAEGSPTPSASSVLISAFEGAPKVRARPSRSVSSSRTFRRTTAADATFMTECSFGVSHELLIRHITDVEPFEPDWEGLTTINMARKGLEGVVRLKEFLPILDEIDLSTNDIGFLTGLPSTLRTLLVPSNKLSSLTSFSHLRNLERLDISNNQVESVHQLACLRHLRELKADNNQIADVGGLAEIDGLLKLSLQGNALESLDFSGTAWSKLETLNLSWNKVSTILGLDRLQNLVMINLDHNELASLTSEKSMPRLRVLRASSNPLASLDVSLWPKLRTLFLDNGCLGNIVGTERLRKLENLSIRDQQGEALTLSMHQVRDVKRLYLSGNPLPTSFPTEKFFNLVYLELAMCQLTTLPANLATLIPNVRALNLNFNFLEDLTPLTGLSRLKKLTVVGARLTKCRPIAQVLGSLVELELADFRMNPITLAYYPPLMLQQGDALPPHANYEILHPDDDVGPIPQSHQWILVDKKFRKALPDSWYYKRVAYRGALLQTCPSLLALDGIDCKRERPKLAKALAGLGK